MTLASGGCYSERTVRFLRLFGAPLVGAFLLGGCASLRSSSSLEAPRAAPPIRARSAAGLDEAYRCFLAARLDLAQGDLAAAASEMERAARLDPTSGFLATQLGNLYLKQGLFPKAIEALERALTLDPKDAEVHASLGNLYLAAQRFPEAASEYREVIRLSPDNREAYVVLSSLYLQLKDRERAAQLLHELLRIDPDNVAAHYYLARVWLDAKAFDRAVEEYVLALEENPDYTPAVKELDLVFQATGDYVRAARVWKKLAQEHPDNPEFFERLGYAYLEPKHERIAEARGAFEDVERLEGDNLDVRFKLGLLYLQESHDARRHGDDAEADRRCDRAIAEFEFIELAAAAGGKGGQGAGIDQVRYYLGSAQIERGALEAAVKTFGAVPTSSPKYPETRAQLAEAYGRGGKNAEAEKTLRTSLGLRPDAPLLYTALASLLRDAKRVTEAIDLLVQAQERFPGDDKVAFALGVAYDESGAFDRSIDQMRKVLALNPNSPEALNYIGYSYADRGIRLDEAENLVRKALELSPQDGYITDSLGWVYFKKHQNAEALKTLRKALTLAPEDPVITEHVADVLRAMGKIREAVEHYRKALDLKPKDADLQRIQGKYRELEKKDGGAPPPHRKRAP